MAYQRQGTLAELQQSGGIGDIVQALQQFAPQLGVNLSDHYTVNQSAEGDGTGNFIQQQLSPELMERLAGYTFGVAACAGGYGVVWHSGCGRRDRFDGGQRRGGRR
jgi:hypothetical protein